MGEVLNHEERVLTWKSLDYYSRDVLWNPFTSVRIRYKDLGEEMRESRKYPGRTPYRG
jgi:hypothetical protein